MFATGDSVTVTNTEGQNPKLLGRTGTVTDITPDGQLIAVKGADNRLADYFLGHPGFRPDQLRKN